MSSDELDREHLKEIADRIANDPESLAKEEKSDKAISEGRSFSLETASEITKALRNLSPEERRLRKEALDQRVNEILQTKPKLDPQEFERLSRQYIIDGTLQPQ